MGTNNGSYYPNVSCASGKWWTCEVQTPTFQGCCISNPCSGDGGGCPTGNLFPAAFNTISSTTTNSTSTPASHTGPNVAAIAGGAAGGAVAGILLLLIIAYFIRRSRKKRNTVFQGSPGPAEHFLSKAPDTPGTAYNDAGYYSGQHLARKERYTALSPDLNLSPGPPEYQSPQRSPNRNTQISEIDSSPIHEFDSGQGNLQTPNNSVTRRHEGVAHGLGFDMDNIAELPNRNY